MRLRLLLPLLLATAGADAAPAVGRTLRAGDTELHVVVDASSQQRAEQLHRWMAEVANASLTAFGRFPLDRAEVRVREIRSSDASPVPWGQTSRRDDVAVLLYVRDDASLEQLRSDWTAVHELAHLFHPYLGRRGRWLAEGLASYYQNVLRARAGLLGEEQAWQRLDAGFGRGRGATTGVRLDELGRRGTMRVYWTGAAYWLEADLALRARGSDLDSVLARYAACCLRAGDTREPAAFIAELDRIADGGVFGDRYRRYAASLEFPSLDAAYRQLGISVGDAGLRFSPQPDAARLRQAVMGRRPVPSVARHEAR
ncbi:MAG TPA: hypothetical protein VGD42_21710 [Lysobacter sp.]